MRLLYCSAVYSYIVCCVSTPFFQSKGLPVVNHLSAIIVGVCYRRVTQGNGELLAVIPVITIWIGILPLVISRDLALALTILGVATAMLM